jgi:hypothetical protein
MRRILLTEIEKIKQPSLRSVDEFAISKSFEYS